MKSLVPGAEVRFVDAQKFFIYERPLGQGGTGNTRLFKESLTEMLYAIKKYEPHNSANSSDLFRRFVDEIRILLRLSHANIVRIYNYYLYPEHELGYIQMEYVDGVPIDQYSSAEWDYEDVFTQVISGFSYLEENGVLHRDVRPQNILVNKDGLAKILDFGFGKQLGENEAVGQSVILNWPVSEFPEEIVQSLQYSHQTEVFFVGKLFQSILREKIFSGDDFKYADVIRKMCEVSPDKRYKSFAQVVEALGAGAIGDLDFNEDEKAIYRKFADDLEEHLAQFNDDPDMVKEPSAVLDALEALLSRSALEKRIQAPNDLISCFVKNAYKYYNKRDIAVSTVFDFYVLLKGKKPQAQKTILENLYGRLRRIPVVIELPDDLPF